MRPFHFNTFEWVGAIHKNLRAEGPRVSKPAPPPQTPLPQHDSCGELMQLFYKNHSPSFNQKNHSSRRFFVKKYPPSETCCSDGGDERFVEVVSLFVFDAFLRLW